MGNADSIRLFARYAAKVAESLGDLVSDFVTINEPNVYAYGSYLTGEWPPGKKSLPAMFRVQKNMIRAHGIAYGIIYEVRKKRGFAGQTLVGVANHIRVFREASLPARPAARFLNYMFNELSTVGTTEGRLLFPLGFGWLSSRRSLYIDFFGPNYYSRDVIRFKVTDVGTLFGEIGTDPELEKSDLGWDIHPEGIYEIAKRYYHRYNVPIFITENGICDRSDARRSQFIYDHLFQIAKLRSEGIPVTRYYHWTLMDNFEWLEGESAPFGLIQCDFATQTRTIKQSGRFFAEICRRKANKGNDR